MNANPQYYKKNTNTQNPPQRKTQVIIGKIENNESVKSGFIIVSKVSENSFIIQSPFKIVNGNSQSSIFIDSYNTFNKPKRTEVIESMVKSLLKMAPSTVMAEFDGRTAALDAVRKVFTFNEDTSGIIQYLVEYINNDIEPKITGLFGKTNKEQILHEAEEETTFKAHKLRVYSSICNNLELQTIPYYSISTCIIDNFEKVLYLPVIDKDSGLIGVKKINDNQRVISIEQTIKSIWPELELDITVTGNVCKINSNFVKKYLKNDIENHSILKIHKNIDINNMTIEMPYKLEMSTE
jgi:hypothetical protein